MSAPALKPLQSVSVRAVQTLEESHMYLLCLPSVQQLTHNRGSTQVYDMASGSS